jgi:hypothetical protein
MTFNACHVYPKGWVVEWLSLRSSYGISFEDGVYCMVLMEIVILLVILMVISCSGNE